MLTLWWLLVTVKTTTNQIKESRYRSSCDAYSVVVIGNSKDNTTNQIKESRYRSSCDAYSVVVIGNSKDNNQSN